MRRLAQTADRRCREEAAENEISVKPGKTPENARGSIQSVQINMRDILCAYDCPN